MTIDVLWQSIGNSQCNKDEQALRSVSSLTGHTLLGLGTAVPSIQMNRLFTSCDQPIVLHGMFRTESRLFDVSLAVKMFNNVFLTLSDSTVDCTTNTNCTGGTRLLCGCAHCLERFTVQRPVVRLAVDFQMPYENSLFYRRVCVT